MLTVLIAVRDDELRQTVTEIVGRQTNRLIVVSTRVQAANAMSAITFDFLITSSDELEFADDFASASKLLQRHLSIVALTSAGSQGKMRGVDLFLEMPFSHETILLIFDIAERDRRSDPNDLIFKALD